MAIHVVRLGSPRMSKEGVRLGTVRRPPRGVAKPEIGRRDFYDVWLPELAPSEQLLSWARSEPLTETRWKQFVRRYQREMNRPESRHLLATLAALSHHTNFAVGCYCQDANRCHRTLLAKLLEASGGEVVAREV